MISEYIQGLRFLNEIVILKEIKNYQFSHKRLHNAHLI